MSVSDQQNAKLMAGCHEIQKDVSSVVMFVLADGAPAYRRAQSPPPTNSRKLHRCHERTEGLPELETRRMDDLETLETKHVLMDVGCDDDPVGREKDGCVRGIEFGLACWKENKLATPIA